MDLLKENCIRIIFKNTKNEYIERIGFFTGVMIQYVNTPYYKEAVVKETELSLLDFGIKKEMVYK